MSRRFRGPVGERLTDLGLWHEECWRISQPEPSLVDLKRSSSSGVDPSATEELPGPQGFEAADVLIRFFDELRKATGDGANKRRAGEKPPWYRDDSHEGAIFSHLTKWKRGELVDPDSGAHPLVHAAWRCLAIACRESGNIPKQSSEPT